MTTKTLPLGFGWKLTYTRSTYGLALDLWSPKGYINGIKWLHFPRVLSSRTGTARGTGWWEVSYRNFRLEYTWGSMQDRF